MEHDIQAQLIQVQQQEEILWQHKSRVTWLTTPDLKCVICIFLLLCAGGAIALKLYKMRRADGYMITKLLEGTLKIISSIYLQVVMLLFLEA